MITLTITLDDDVFSRLQARAQEAGVSSEELAAAFVATETCGDADGEEADEYRAMAERHLARFPTVFRRLAE
jgi:hypothetical protein